MDDRRLLLAAALGFGSAALLLSARRARRRDGDGAAAATGETAEATWMPEATLVAVLSGLERWGWRVERGGVYIYIYDFIITCMCVFFLLCIYILY